MWRFWDRWKKRQRDLRAGVDADLVQANRRRFKAGLCLLAAALGTHLLGERARLPDWAQVALNGASAVTLLIGFVLLYWARAERGFLGRPDRDEPPRIFRI
jgi:hypothetical protein